MSTNKGIAKLNVATMQFTNYGPLDGLPWLDFTGWNACFQSAMGEMFFGGFSGATAFFPDREEETSYVPPMVRTGLKIHGLQVGVGAKSPVHTALPYLTALDLSHDQNALSLEFTAVDFLDSAAPDIDSSLTASTRTG